MAEIDFHNYAAACFRDSPPPCTCACPLGVDVRSMVEKIRKGSFTAAYRVYRNSVLFPGIVSKICPEPCREVCVRRDRDEAIHLRKLEAACVAGSGDRRPIQFNMPKNPFSVAVVGAGLSGLACALKLASRNYTVHLYCRSENPGGRLRDLLPAGEYLPELKLEFDQVEYELHGGEAVADPNKLGCDAVYIATGSGGDDFGLGADAERRSLATRSPGIFLGGGLLGANSLQAIEHGVRASNAIEKYLKVGSMEGTSISAGGINPCFYSLPMEVACSEIGDGEGTPGKEETQKESSRCLRCNCAECRQNCEMMERFRLYPTRIATDIVSSLNVIERLTERVAQRFVNSCSQCGVCRDVCPRDVNMEECVLEGRRKFFENGSLPPAYHDFWVQDMQHATNAADFLWLPDAKKADYLFFPGCQLGASDIGYVVKTFEYLRGLCPDTALLQYCCGVPVEWAGDAGLRDSVIDAVRAFWGEAGEPVVLTACPTCQKTLGRYLPEARIVSLYEYLDKNPWEARMDSGLADEVYVFDPCSSRGQPEVRRSVRNMATKLGVGWREDEGARQRCCGCGGHIYSANPELFETIVSNRLKAGGTQGEFLCYCSNCRDTFARAGRPSRHLLDFLFNINPAGRAAPSLGQRRRNRLMVKRHFFPEAKDDMDTDIRLVIADAALVKMDTNLILDEDVARVIAHCEATAEKIYNNATGSFTGHLRQGSSRTG